MERIIDFAKNTAETDIISLDGSSDDERALALYKRFGFEKVGKFDGFMKINGESVSCNIMRLDLFDREGESGEH